MNKLIIAGLTAEQIRKMLDDDHWRISFLPKPCAAHTGVGMLSTCTSSVDSVKRTGHWQLQSSDVAVKRDGTTTAFTSLRSGARNVTASKNRPDQAFAKGSEMRSEADWNCNQGSTTSGAREVDRCLTFQMKNRNGRSHSGWKDSSTFDARALENRIWTR